MSPPHHLAAAPARRRGRPRPLRPHAGAGRSSRLARAWSRPSRWSAASSPSSRRHHRRRAFRRASRPAMAACWAMRTRRSPSSSTPTSSARSASGPRHRSSRRSRATTSTSGQVKIEFRMFPFLGRGVVQRRAGRRGRSRPGQVLGVPRRALQRAGRREQRHVHVRETRRHRAAGRPRRAEVRGDALGEHVSRGDPAGGDDARAAGVSSTPTFFITGANGDETKIVGAQAYSQFNTAIDKALAESGTPVGATTAAAQ